MKNEFWEQIFTKYNILEQIEKNGRYEITSSAINEFKEARLMTKFDNASQLPDIFAENDLSILPISRGSYIISPMEIFSKFPEIKHNEEICYVRFPEHIQSLSSKNITSEALALNCAYISGIFNDFIEDEDLVPTINGRMSSSLFDFNVKNSKSSQLMPISVKNAQIEIDAGYEGIETLSLIEAKNHFADDFVIRQLYYPMRLWQSNVSKAIKTIFMVHTNDIFYLYEYKFNDFYNYNSLELSKFKRYSFEKIDIELEDIEKVLYKISEIKEPEIPFPQADSFERVINLCELLKNKPLTKTDITLEYGFDKRQTDYYINAAKYLDLVDEKNGDVFLSTEGNRIINLSHRQKQLSFVEKILSHSIFKFILQKQLKTGITLSNTEIIEIMKHYSLYNLKSESTIKRRSSTISSWIDWILSLINA